MKKMTAMLFSLAVGLNTVSMAAKADTPKEQSIFWAWTVSALCANRMQRGEMTA